MDVISITHLWLYLGIPEVLGEATNSSFISVAVIKYHDKAECWDTWSVSAHNSRLWSTVAQKRRQQPHIKSREEWMGAHLLVLNTLHFTVQNPLPGEVPPTVDLLTLINVIETTRHRHAHRPIWSRWSRLRVSSWSIKYCVDNYSWSQHGPTQKQQQVLSLCHLSTLHSLLKVGSSDCSQCQKAAATFKNNMENMLLFSQL